MKEGIGRRKRRRRGECIWKGGKGVGVSGRFQNNSSNLLHLMSGGAAKRLNLQLILGVGSIIDEVSSRKPFRIMLRSVNKWVERR